MKSWLSRLVGCAFLVGLAFGHGCGGSDTPKPGATCVLNSECNNPLSCTYGRCHVICVDSRDCKDGGRCVKSMEGGTVCLLPEEDKCTLDSDCKIPLVCGRDLKCRNQCKEDRDCPTRTQKCATPDNKCAEPNELTEAGGLKDPTGPAATGGAGGGSRGGAGGGAAGGSGGAIMTGSPDAGRDLAAAGGAGGGAPTDGPVAPAGDAPRMVPDATAPVEGITATPAIVKQGDTSVKIVVVGKNLGSPGDFQLEDLRVTLENGGSDTTFTLSVTVPHGAKIGAKALSFTTLGGSYKKDAAVTVSAITSGPMGNDTTGRGSSDSPYRTFKKGISVAAAGDTVQLLDGDYRMADGETWMVPIPEKVTVQGQTAAGTKLIGPGETGAATYVDGLLFAGDGGAKDLTVVSFQYNINVGKPNQTVTLDNVKSLRARYYGLYVTPQALNAKVTITGKDTEFASHASSAVYFYGPAGTLTITTVGDFSTTSYPTIAIGGSKSVVTLSGLTILASPNSYGAINASVDTTLKIDKANIKDSLNLTGTASTFEITNSTISVAPAVSVAVTFGGGKLTIKDSLIEGATTGVSQSGANVEAVLRGTTIKTYKYYGYRISSGKLDLGNMTEKGNNKFEGPDTGAHGLYDQRGAAVNTITSSATTYNGLAPPAGKVTGRVDVAGKYYISTVGNVIEFFDL